MSSPFALSTSVAVIGAGTMGNGIAQVAAADEIDTAMRIGTSHPRGLLPRSDEPGAKLVATVLRNLQSNHGDTRCRVPSLLRRLSINGRRIHD